MQVSVIVPAYDRAHCIKNAIDSAINQSLKPSEIIIVDDGSNDDLDKVVGSYFQPYIKLVKHDKNRGASAARNTGITSAISEYVAFLDSDDIWYPNKLRKQTRFMQENNLDICCSNFSLYRSKQLKYTRAYRPYKSIRLSISEIAWGCFVSPGTTLICKRELLLDIGGYDTSFTRFEDWDLLLRLSCHNNIGWFDEVLSAIYVDNHVSEKDELQGLEHIKLKFSGNARHCVRQRIKSSYWFHLASVHFRYRRYARFIFCLFLSLVNKPIGNFPIKVILFSKLHSL